MIDLHDTHTVDEILSSVCKIKKKILYNHRI